MGACKHARLTLMMPTTEVRLRCRHCHLTLPEEELEGGSCPECLEESGRRRSDFERTEIATADAARVRCEDCGLVTDAE